MTDNVIIATSMTTNDDTVTLSDFEDLLIAPNVSVTSFDGDAIYYDGTQTQPNNAKLQVDVEGNAVGLFGVSTFFHTFGTLYANIGAHAEVVGEDYGILAATGTSQNFLDFNVTIVNAGTVFGDDGVMLGANGASISNSGEISGQTAIALNCYSGGVVGKDDLITNSATGLITGQIAVDGASSGLSLINDGTISATGSSHVIGVTGGHATVSSSGVIEGLNEALDFGAGDDVVFNSGTIAVTGANAISVAGGGLRLTNSGRISAKDDAVDITAAGPLSWIVNQTGGVISASVGDDAVNGRLGSVGIVNHGEIDGYSYLGLLSSVVNTGKIVGQVYFVGLNASMRNSGDISFGANDYAVRFAGGAGSYDVLKNSASGVIEGTDGYAVYDAPGGTLAFVNLGEVFGLVGSDAIAQITNVGTINGSIGLGVGGSLIVNHGEVIGNIGFSGTGNIYRGQTGEVTGTIYGRGADGRYIGGAGVDNFDMTNSGAAYVSGGAGDDVFTFTAAGLTAATTLLGGDGQDTLIFSTAGTVAASALAHVAGVEIIDLASGANTIALNDSMVTAADGGAVTVNGASAHDVIDASAVVNAADTVTIYGAGGADAITAAGAKDVFVYDSRLDSTGTVYDTIAGANFNVDRFDVAAAAGTILAVNTAVTAGSLSTATFNADLAADLPAAKLGAHDAVLFTANAGTLSGQTFLVVDVNGTAGYQANADLVIHLAAATGTLTKSVFL